MSKKTKAKKTGSKKAHLKLVREPASTKMGFWLTSDLIARMRSHVDKNRSAPELMTINSFVRDALEASLSKEARKEYQRAYQKKYRDGRTPEQRERASEKQKEWRIAHPEACDRHVTNRKKGTT